MTQKQFENLIKSYQDEIKETKIERPLTAEELRDIEENINNIQSEYSEAFTAALQDNFSQFESLPYALRNYLGAKKLQEFRKKFGENPSIDNLSVRNYLRSKTMDAAFRAGVSVEKNSENTRENARSIDSFMNTYLMQKTMIPPTEDEQRALADRIGQDNASVSIAQNLEKQRVMAKMLFMSQLGKYEVYDKARLGKELEEPLSETIAHGSRTNFVLPVGTDTQQVFDAFLGNNMGESAGVNKRTAATHYVKRRAIDKNGFVKSETKESKTYSPFKVFSNQYGMNIAAGGIGVTGPDRKAIVGDGESGHVYMRIEEGDKKHCGSLLFGIEGSEPGKSNYLGHSHGASGTGAKQSAFFADKQIVGKKTGGRQVDLSGLTTGELSALLESFDKQYSELQKNANTKQGRNRLAKVNDMLIGKYMSIDALQTMCNGIGMDRQNLRDAIERARGGYLTKATPSQVGLVEFKQNVRAMIPQDTACYLASERFKSAGDDLGLAVGAIKELMLTHETRKLKWRLRHPIKNYREKSMIKDLKAKLKTEKKFSDEDIAKAFNAPTDTFSMYWGENLSNDYAARRFAVEKGTLFDKEHNKNPIGKDVKEIGDNFYAKDKDTLKQRMSQEQKQMTEDLYGDMRDPYNSEDKVSLDAPVYVYDDTKSISSNDSSFFDNDDEELEMDSHDNKLDGINLREPFPISEEELDDSKKLPFSKKIELVEEKFKSKEMI